MDKAATWRFAQSECRQVESSAKELEQICIREDADAMRRKLMGMFERLRQLDRLYETLSTPGVPAGTDLLSSTETSP